LYRFTPDVSEIIVGGAPVGLPSFEMESLGATSDAGPWLLMKFCGYVGVGCRGTLWSECFSECAGRERLKSQMHTPRRMSAAPAATAMPIIAEVGSPLCDAGFDSDDVDS
jgi:hypothetical protein